MIKNIAIGGSLAFAAAVQPGPFQAYLLSRVAAIGWRRTLPAAFAPLITDGPIAGLALLVLGNLSPEAQSALRLAGGVFLLYLAWGSLRQWLQKNTPGPERVDRALKTILEAALVNALNPNPYLGWVLVLGPVVVSAWAESPSQGIAVVVAFYATMVTMSVVLIVLFGSTLLLGARFQRGLMLVSACLLFCVGAYQLAKGVGHLWAS